MNYKKADYTYMAALRVRALCQIANKLGKEHTVTKLMGCAAWGRSDFEHGPDSNLQTEIIHKAGLDGMVCILKTWCRLNGDNCAMRVINEFYPGGFTSKPT